MADARSSNPFRRKATIEPSAGLGTTATPPTSTVGLEAEVESSPADVDRPSLQPNSSDYFRQHLQSQSHANQPPPSTTFQKPKVVKKVRVQSPPPSSPESASATHDDYTRHSHRHSEDSDTGSADDDDVEPEDPFRATAPPLSAISHNIEVLKTSPPPIIGQQPPNPFKKTLEDMEQGARVVANIPHAPTTPKGSLDVDAFRRLLMTGQATGLGTVASATTTASPSTTYFPSQITDAASVTDGSSVSRQSILDQPSVQETPRTSHEISEAEGENERLGLISNPPASARQGTPATLRKKPPPPSSRHGKLIIADEAQKPKDGRASGNALDRRPSSSSGRRESGTSLQGGTLPSAPEHSPPSDVNKPLPPSPAPRFTDENQESIFDRESAGKVPGVEGASPDTNTTITPRPPTPPNAAHVNTTAAAPPDPRKPAPPPRRNRHQRTGSKASVAAIPQAIPPAGIPLPAEESLRRSSQDSTLSRSSSIRANNHAPAPPPPRRPNHVSRQSTSSTPTFSTTTSPAPSTEHHVTFPHIASDLASFEPSPVHHQTTSFPLLPKAKSTGPPPPPSRHSSVRSGGRPASISSFDATSRRVKDKDGTGVAPPPPPPKRSRAGSGRGSSDTGAPGRLLPGSVIEEPTLTASGTATPAVGSAVMPPTSGSQAEGTGADVLADFEALQREIDALRGRYEKRDGGSTA
jgi:hypothetical protein